MFKIIVSIILGSFWAIMSVAMLGAIGLGGGFQSTSLPTMILVIFLFLPGILWLVTLNLLPFFDQIITFPLVFIYGTAIVYGLFTIIGKLNRSRFNKRINTL